MRPRLQNRVKELCFDINSAIFTIKIKNVHLVAGILIALAIAIYDCGKFAVEKKGGTLIIDRRMPSFIPRKIQIK